jgi:hypothetical protein
MPSSNLTRSPGRASVFVRVRDERGGDGESSEEEHRIARRTDVLVAPPRRDAWIVGNEPCIAFDFSSDIQRYAKG